MSIDIQYQIPHLNIPSKEYLSYLLIAKYVRLDGHICYVAFFLQYSKLLLGDVNIIASLHKARFHGMC